MTMVSAVDHAEAYRSLRDAVSLIDIGQRIERVLLPGYRLLRVEKPSDSLTSEIQIFLVNDIEASVVYQCTLTVLPLSQYTRPTVLQKKIRCSPEAQHAVALDGLINQVCFNYVLTLYDLLVSPDHQKDLTEHRWLRLLSSALAHGAYVYLFDNVGGRMQPIPTQAALNEVMDRLWSRSNVPCPITLITKTDVLATEAMAR
ncbi:hypothetical protein NJC38_28995 [Pseudomonas sp. 21LCFQ010]|uniref:hypothetical protein n=1 Tax=Pseudomonas sp. 21LCFQ010 TaxID=2957506 RepID=UPI002096DBB3|nr:hypothetical protein [Pseudomonas sp. 21LCFQ010]MCO8166163.1 hypothetical protein [Pseudomonas sp. 21LCFQ010]